jgi:hypothetical protein
MPKQFIKRFSKVPPPVVIVAVLIAVVGASGLALLLTKSEPKAEALVAPRAARIERVSGSVGLTHGLTDDAQSDWAQAAANAPLTVGDRIYTDDDSHAAVAFTGRNYARLNPGASLDVLSLSDRSTQLALRDGSAIFDIGDLGDEELFEVATPNGAIDFDEPGLYQVGIGDNGNTIVSVLSGLAQVVGLDGTGQIGKGEILTLVGQAAAQILLSKIAPDLAGNIVDDYYDYRYPNTYDGRYSDYDAYLEDPYYYDPYSQSAGYRYLPQEIPGVYDLDRYGDWADVDGYGHCWSPRVSAGWSPYRDGYWDVNNTWGPTWISQEPWGYAPYHYGRWAYVNNQRWVWVPAEALARPVYSPALVAFIPFEQTNQIAWVPLAPGEQYVPRYYDANFQPQYLASAEVIREVVNVQQNYVNLNYPAAVTVIPEQYFTREFDSRVITTLNPQLIAQAQPVVDPFAVNGLRQIALGDKEGWRRIKVPGDVRREVFNTPVITSVEPALPPVQSDLYQALQVHPVPEKQRKKRLKLDDSGQVVAERRWNGLPQAPVAQSSQYQASQERGQRIEALAQQAARGDKSARREMRELKREQRKEVRLASERAIAGQSGAQPNLTQQEAARAQRGEQKRLERAGQQAVSPEQQAQRLQTREQRKEQKRLERRQREVVLQQRQPVAAGQQNEQRKLMRQQARAQRAQQDARQQAQKQAQVVNQQREQIKAQRRAERQQRAMVEAQQRQTQQKQVQQVQAQQRQAQQRQAQQAAQHNQEREARKAQRQIERQQREQQVMNQQRAIQQQQNQQRKQAIIVQQAEKNRVERRAAPQQQSPQPQVQRAPAYKGPPAQQNSQQNAQQNQADKSQRKAEREQRRAEKRKP